MDTLGKAYIVALWIKRIIYLKDMDEALKETDNVEARLKPVFEEFGDPLDLPSHKLKSDAAGRLEWLKRRVAKEFEKELKKPFNIKKVVSPIEQIFLMEWKFARLDEKLEVELEPQKTVITHT